LREIGLARTSCLRGNRGDLYLSDKAMLHRMRDVEWITLGLVIVCYAFWAACVCWLSAIAPLLAGGGTILALVLHSSLSHEVIHGHPLPSRRASEGLMQFNPGLAVPFLRFRDTHLAHHKDARLTDPYDDPESNYLDPAQWAQMPGWLRLVRRANNTMAGRIVLGPLIGQISFMTSDLKAIRAGDAEVLRGWVWHLPAVLGTLVLVAVSPMPVWVYLICAYVALGLLKIRTFLEHQAHAKCRARTVIVEDRGPLAFLFLNNNLHMVHHMHPNVPWYRLPKLYTQNKARYLTCNEGYVFRSYGQVFVRFFWRAKDPVAHPLWPSDKN